jgi:hypothetical protein
MRQAPAVRVPCTIGVGWRALPAQLAALAAFAVVLWALQWAAVKALAPLAPPVMFSFALGLAALTGWVVYRATRHQAASLEWNGAAWALTLDPEGSAVELPRLDVMMDLGRALLLRAARGDGTPLWLSVGLDLSPAALRALCRAAYGRAPGPAQNLLPERPQL